MFTSMAVSNLIVANNWEDDLEPSMEYHLQQQQLVEQQHLQHYQQYQQFHQHPVPKSEPQEVSHIDPSLLSGFQSVSQPVSLLFVGRCHVN